ncbi:MAG: hypothetical protein GY696_10250, partial [Gammaproteobacteria bacterium]|nr:hypothetical protein [Gammaproteobacteria bacterium]
MEELQKDGIKIGFIPWTPDPVITSKCFQEFPFDSMTTTEILLKKCPHPGFLVEFCFLILELLGIPLSKQRLIAVDHETYGAKINGTWRGLIRQIMDGEFHTSLPVFTPLAERAEVVDFTYPVKQNNLVFLTRKPSGSSAISISPLTVFQLEVWLMMFAVAVAVAGILIIEQLLSHSLSTRTRKNFFLTVPQKFLDVIVVFTGKGSLETHTKTKMHAGKISLGVWALSMVVFASLYSGAILVSLVKPKVQTTFNDIPSLTNCIIRGKCFIFVYHKGSSYLRLTSDREHATSEEKLLKRAIKANPVKIYDK